MWYHFVLKRCRKLVCVTGPVAAKPPRIVKLPATLRSGINLEAKTREPIITRRQNDPLRNLERFEQSFKLRGVVKLDVLAGIQVVVNWRGEKTPAFGRSFVNATK